MSSNFVLSASLPGHSADVRTVSFPKADLLLSGSRDNTARIWRPHPSAPQAWDIARTLTAHDRFVNAVAYAPPNEMFPEGLVVTAGQDRIINLHDPTAPDGSEPVLTLVGHDENVCALDVAANGDVLSGSWDSTARIWRGGKEVHVLKGHQASVWAVRWLPDGQSVLTASADKTIRRWSASTGKLLHTYTGHADAVRGLALLEGGLWFASCSNDAEIRLWTFDGDLILTLSGHTSFVYAVDTLASGELVSASEDRSVKVWRDGECVQTLTHPAISIWSVSACPATGDIATGASDGVVRVFTRDPARWADEATRQAFEKQVAEQSINSQQVGDLKMSDVKGPEALAQDGTKDGQVIMVREGTAVAAHQWSAATRTWQKIGDVVDAVGSSRKQLHSDGKEYDYVFDVDIAEGQPPLKLPFNANENPYVAAQRFLLQHELPLAYIDQVVQFIEQNTKGVELGPSSNEYVDPYTGASRYRAGTGSAPAAGAGAGAGGFVDPFTGGGAYSTQPAPPKPSVLPVKGPFLSFTQANVAAIENKIRQLNESIDPSLKLSDGQLDALGRVGAYVGAGGKGAEVKEEDVAVLRGVVQGWPEAERFPALDLYRALLAHSALPSTDILLPASSWPAASPAKERQTTQMLALRGLANAFRTEGGRARLAGADAESTLDALAQAQWEGLNKLARVAFASVAFNYSVLAVTGKLPSPTAGTKLLNVVQLVLEKEQADSETIYRALVAFGNLLHAKEGFPAQVKRGKDLARAAAVRQGAEQRIRDLVDEVGRL